MGVLIYKNGISNWLRARGPSYSLNFEGLFGLYSDSSSVPLAVEITC